MKGWLRSQLSKGLLGLLVLVVLGEEGPLHGYWLRERLGVILGSHPPESTLYEVLRRLEKEGLLESYWGVGGTGRARKYYRLTPQGLGEAKSASSWLCRIASRIDCEGVQGGGSG